MYQRNILLSDLDMDKKGYIEEIDCESGIKRRLLDLGLVKGTVIFPVLISPSGDPKAFLVRGSTIAIRKEDTKRIKIRLEN